MTNQEYLDRMMPEQRRRHRVEGTAGIVRLLADLIEIEVLYVDPDTLFDDGKTFSLQYS